MLKQSLGPDLFENGYLTDECFDMLEEKIYTPYMITESTQIHFSGRLNQLNSFIDILKQFTSQKHQSIKFYFKVVNDNDDQVNDIVNNSTNEINKSNTLKSTSVLEFNFKHIKIMDETLTSITIKDITNLLKAHEDIIDNIYQEAIDNLMNQKVAVVCSKPDKTQVLKEEKSKGILVFEP